MKTGWQYCGVTLASAPAPPLLATRPRRAWVVLGLGVLVLLLHGWLLGTLPAVPGRGGAGDAPRVLQVRQIALPAAPVAAPVSEPLPAARAPVRHAARSAPAASAVAATAPPPSASLDTGGEALPVYATRLPPAATLQYAVQREGPGRAGVQAELRWRPDDAGRYTLTLGLAAAGWASVGEIDAHGLAPERHVETRRGREVRAANFQRDSGRITFSGPQVEYPLLPGAQDRLSWMLQLPAVLAANPALAEAGRQLQLFVAGARGDAAVWTFTSLGAEAVDVPAGPVSGAVHFRREAERPYDTRVDIWLDPARHHLPARVRLLTRADGEATELLLLALALP